MKFLKTNLTIILMSAVILLVIAIRFAEPVADGDLFFQMAYGKYLLEHRTLIPDHSIYSWTQTDKKAIYCAWMSEMFLYLLYQACGLTGIFILRYVCILLTVALIFFYVRRAGGEKTPFTYLYIIIFILSSHSGTLHKPEIFSFVLFNLVVWLYFNIKLDVAAGKNFFRKIYLFPIIMLLWVNTHGGFIFGITFLFLVTAGEIMNYFFLTREKAVKKHKKKSKITRGGFYFPLKHLIVSLVLSGLVVFATPYTYRYPLRLLTIKSRVDLYTSKIAAYRSIFAPALHFSHYIELFFFMAMVLLVSIYYVYFVKRERIDFSLIIINLVFGYVFASLLRSTYLWPPVFLYSALYLQRNSDWAEQKKWIGVIIRIFVTGYFLFLSVRAVVDSYYIPFTNQWMGFGIGYQNPVVETEFLKKYHPGNTLFNDYETGGYLIWELYPEYKVSIDLRAFPFTQWYPEYEKFADGSDFDGFLQRYPCDVVMMEFKLRCIENFLDSPSWKPVFYGPTAVIFVKREMKLPMEASNFMPDRFDDLKNIENATYAFMFALNVNDDKLASHILDVIKRNLYFPGKAELIKILEIHREAGLAYEAKDYGHALELLEGCKRHEKLWNRYLLNRLYRWRSITMASKGEFFASFVCEQTLLKDDPMSASAFFNAGISGYLAEKWQSYKDLSWRLYLEKFLSLAPEDGYAVEAKALLDGKKTPLHLKTYPSEPAVLVSGE